MPLTRQARSRLRKTRALVTLLLSVALSPYALPEDHAASAAPVGDIRQARAYWLAGNTIAWDVPADSKVRLHFSDDASLAVTAAGLTGGDSIALKRDGVVHGATAEKFRHLAGLPAYTIEAGDLPLVPGILKQQFAVSAEDAEGQPVDATGLQPAGVLDDLYTYNGDLGVTFDGDRPVIRVWAPTARSVNLRIYPDADQASRAMATAPMVADPGNGTWSVIGEPGWDRRYYLFEVEVFTRATGRFETNLVTDPYSLNLSMNGKRSQVIRLSDADLKPAHWDALQKPGLAGPEDIVIYELHVRDFSISDATVPAALRGTFAAFAFESSAGSRHLRDLSGAGLSHVHLLPVADCASIDENRAARQTTGDLSVFAPDSPQQQAAVAAIRDRDGFNWCYDPVHYTAPEGSYSTDPDGTARIREFREMVAGLNELGLRVVMDVVYNHTHASGQAGTSVLDKLVPDYYHRLDNTGSVATSSCCPNTATEHNMMEKLMIDSLLTWAVEYRIDGFRFDLMGHHTRANIENARNRLRALNKKDDGVDGGEIYLYGEGWNFGEVADNARFDQATQDAMGRHTGVGTFNDRIRDGLRGGGPFDTGADLVRRQGFINGLFYDPNRLNSGSPAEKDDLLLAMDWIRIGLAGGLSDYPLIDRHGNEVVGGQVDYLGHGAGYASDPQEVVNYAAAHDDATLYDTNQYKLPVTTGIEDRVRVQNLANSVIALSQGVPFFHAGQDMLRSKSMDRNSYDSGDWFNVLDFSYSVNGFGRGLPAADDNRVNWSVAGPLLADPSLVPGKHDISRANRHLREMLRIRRGSGLFRLASARQVIQRVKFHNTGPDQVPGLIVMSISDGNAVAIVVLFNARTDEQAFALAEGGDFDLHPVQKTSADPVVRTSRFDRGAGEFHVPARTTAVFVRK